MRENPEELTVRLKSDDKQALSSLFDLFSNDLYKILYHRVSDKSQIHDFIQDTFVKLWDRRQQIDPKQSIKNYIFRIAINLVHDFNKHEQIKDKYQDKIIDMQQQTTPDHSDLIESVHAIIATLPPEQATTFNLSKFAELSYSEIAEVMNVSVKTVESRISKVLKVLRENIDLS